MFYVIAAILAVGALLFVADTETETETTTTTIRTIVADSTYNTDTGMRAGDAFLHALPVWFDTP